jgi:hypothetical protein
MLKHWVLRPIVLFAATYAGVGALHELAHALTAYVLGVPSTLFHLYVDLEPGDGNLDQQAIIRVAGPVFCLCLGLVCWLAYKKAGSSRAALPLLYLAWFGIVTFFGNLMSTPFVGDFSDMALAFGLSMPVRYAAAVVGFLAVCGLSFFMGTELRQWSPAGVSASRAMLGMIVLPAIVGTALALLIFLPFPPGWIPARIGESAFWIFAAIGTFVSRKRSADSSRDFGLGWPDLALLLAAVLAVRLMAVGIAFTP